MVACKNKESYLIKILIGDEGDGYSGWSIWQILMV